MCPDFSPKEAYVGQASQDIKKKQNKKDMCNIKSKKKFPQIVGKLAKDHLLIISFIRSNADFKVHQIILSIGKWYASGFRQVKLTNICKIWNINNNYQKKILIHNYEKKKKKEIIMKQKFKGIIRK